MTVSIIWTNRGLQRLDSVGGYIQKDNPAAAARVVGGIADAVERLAEFPHSGRPGRIEGTRELVIPRLPYIVAYRVTVSAVEILTVFHTSQQWPERL